MDTIEYFTERPITLDDLEQLAHEHGYTSNRVFLVTENLVIQCSTESGFPYLRISHHMQPHLEESDLQQFEDLHFSPRTAFGIEFRKAWVDDLITFMLLVLDEYGGYVGTEITAELMNSESLPELEKLYERYK